MLAGLGQGGAAARPLDGGVLTRRGARAPARGPATAPWLAAPPFHSLAVLLSVVRSGAESLRCGRERSGERRRERAAKKEWVRVWRARPRAGFCSPYPRARPSDQNQRRRSNRAVTGPGGRERARHFAGPGPGCGLGTACTRANSWAVPFSAALGRNRED